MNALLLTLLLLTACAAPYGPAQRLPPPPLPPALVGCAERWRQCHHRCAGVCAPDCREACASALGQCYAARQREQRAACLACP